jgi:pimeloyl-ACP methyl ester carboxylesterase
VRPERPFVREAGTGPTVICLHSSASSSGQWRALTEHLAARFRVVAVDLYGSGKTGGWPEERPMRLDDEVALLEPVFRAAGDRFHLVGHSYGGAVALMAALTLRDRLISLTVYEPVLFCLLMADAPESDAAREILAVRDDAVRLVDEGDLEASARRFVDYWSGEGAFDALPERMRPAIAEGMRAVKQHWHALVHEPTPLGRFASIHVPTLLLTGTASKAPTLAIARLLAKTLPRVTVRAIEGAGHMGPISHPEQVNPVIEQFLEGF